MKPYSIAMVAACPFPANYGSPASIREMSQTLSRLGHRVHVVTYPYGDELPVENVQLHRVPDWGWSKKVRVGPSLQKPLLDFLMVMELHKVVRRERIQVIHTHNYEGALVGLMVRWLTGIPLLYNAVNTMSDELPGYGFIRPAFMARWLAAFLDWCVPIFPDHITVVSKELGDWLRNKGIPDDKISLVPAGIHPAMFDHPDSDKIRKRLEWTSNPVILYAGTLDAFQRIDYLLRAFSIVARSKPDSRLLIVNNLDQPFYLKHYQAMVRDMGISDRVHWTGQFPLAELPDYLASASVAVMPRPECPGHPVKLLNYMGAGKAIVSFAGSAKGLRNGHDALIIPDHDWEKMGRSILSLLEDPATADKLGENARQTVIRHFDWEILARKIELIYEELIDKRRGVDQSRSGNPIR
jgi:1,2-diacylglycerol 3-alpha-glucosyltransferase